MMAAAGRGDPDICAVEAAAAAGTVRRLVAEVTEVRESCLLATSSPTFSMARGLGSGEADPPTRLRLSECTALRENVAALLEEVASLAEFLAGASTDAHPTGSVRRNSAAPDDQGADAHGREAPASAQSSSSAQGFGRDVARALSGSTASASCGARYEAVD